MDNELDKELPNGIDPVEPKYKALLNNLQGNILRGHGRDHVFLAFFKVKAGKGDDVRKQLGKFCKDHLRSVLKQEEEHVRFLESKEKIYGDVFVNVFLTMAGYKELKIKIKERPSDPRFKKGMKASRRVLKDPELAKWEEYYRGDIHFMILLADDDASYLGRQVGILLQGFNQVAEGHLERGDVLRNDDDESIEHFGYVDGRSQPLFFKDDLDREREQKGGIDNKMACGFRPNAPLNLVRVEEPGKTNGFGSFFVFRKLEQNVRKFKQMEAGLADALELQGKEDRERAGALAVGRFEDGTPAELQSGEGMHHPVTNNFNYSSDRAGSRCPRQAHIRTVNRRADDYKDRMHRIVRRGMPYGDRKTKPGKEKSLDELPTGGVGLLFMCFQAKISRQFEYLQKRANDQNAGLDPVIGQVGANEKPRAQKWPVEWGASDPSKKVAHKPFPFHGAVTMKGGEYFFAPSVGFLQNLK